MKTEIVRLERISKVINGEDALININLSLYKGEILGVIGLNGSGKSTLVELLSGAITPDRGSVFIDNELVNIQSQSQAHRLGIQTIRQNSKLVPGFTIAENILVIRENKPGKLVINFSEIIIKTRQLLMTVGLDLEPETIVAGLSPFEKQLVEIAKAVNEKARIIIMDDVTDDYSPKDFEFLKIFLEQVRQQGIAIIITSRRLEGIMEISDRITVIREGVTVRTLYRDEFSKQNLIKLLIGRNFETNYMKSNSNIGDEVVRLDEVCTDTFQEKISISIKKGEILSIIDIDGFFSYELVQMFLGQKKLTAGTFWLLDKKIQIRNYRDAFHQGIGLISEDWYKNIFPYFSLEDNLAFLIYEKMSHGLLTTNVRSNNYSTKIFFQTFNPEIKAHQLLAFDELNQIEIIKVIMFRWLLRKPKVLIMIKPSLRIDLVARQTLYKLIENLASDGIAILLISTDLEEAAAISDRVLVVQDVSICGEYSYNEARNLSYKDVI